MYADSDKPVKKAAYRGSHWGASGHGHSGQLSEGKGYTRLSLEEKRKLYKCGVDYVTLEEIGVWSRTRKDLYPLLLEKQSAFNPAPSLDSKISLWRGDITRLEIDAIVNSANTTLLGGGGVDYAIHRAAGHALYEECLTLKGCAVGQAKLTSGHRLPAKYILHAVCPGYEEGESKALLQSCYETCFELVREHNIRSVAFCCMATGIYDFPHNEAAEVAIDVTRKWLEKNGDKIDRVIFCVYFEMDYKIYLEKLCRYFPPLIESDIDQVSLDEVSLAYECSTVEVMEPHSKPVDSLSRDLQSSDSVAAELPSQVGELVRKHQTEIRRYADTLAHKDEIIRGHEAQIAALRYRLDAAIADRYKASQTHQELQRHFDALNEPLCVRPETWSVPRTEIEQLHKQQIGAGAWGTVYSAKFRGKDVAVKISHPQIHHQLTIELLKREVTIMSCMQHPNLVRFIAAVWDEAVERREDSPIIVSELMDTSLRSAYEQGMDLSDSLISIFCDVAYALHYLHQQRQPVIHRDVSAPNILLKSLPGSLYRAKLSDFGSANLIRQSHTPGAGAIIYCAPEMFPTEDVTAAPQPQTTKVDVFSFGILLLEAVCREMPTQQSRRRMLQKVEGEWEEMSTLIVHCIRPSPSDRPTMADILDKLNSMSEKSD